MPRRLAAILAADIVGFSRLMGADEAGTLARLKALLSELVRPQITARSGRIVKLMGNGLLAEFPSVVEAVTCAVDIQRALDADVTMVLDECTGFPATEDEAAKSMRLSMAWAKRSKACSACARSSLTRCGCRVAEPRTRADAR